jgi:hypothetical protein
VIDQPGAQKAAFNRFVVGNPARDVHFYGRASDVEMILAQPWNWLCGQRRLGKTSLLFRLEAVAESRGWVPLFCSLAHINPAAANGRMLFRKSVVTWQRRLQRCRVTTTDLLDLEPEDAFAELVSRVLQSSPRVLFLWDEAERLIDVESADPGFLERLRSALELEGNFGFVIAATQLLSDLYGRESHCSPFLTSFRWRPIGPLDRAESRALLLAENTGGWSSPPSAAVIEAMLDWSGGHPYILQEGGFQLEERLRRGEPLFELADWQRAITSNQSIAVALRDDFAKLTIIQQEVLSALCRQQAPLDVDQLSRAIARPVEQIEEAGDFLSNYGYIRKTGRYELRFGFYRRFAEMTVSTADSYKVSRISRTTIFISYAHADLEWLERVRKFLRPAVNGGDLDEWSDHKIRPGTLWLDEIEHALANARIALLLVSQDFISSDFIAKIELPHLLARANRGQCQVLCLHLRPSSLAQPLPPGATLWKQLSEYQALNSPDCPLASLSPTEIDAELARVAAEIAGLSR